MLRNTGAEYVSKQKKLWKLIVLSHTMPNQKNRKICHPRLFCLFPIFLVIFNQTHFCQNLVPDLNYICDKFIDMTSKKIIFKHHNLTLHFHKTLNCQTIQPSSYCHSFFCKTPNIKRQSTFCTSLMSSATFCTNLWLLCGGKKTLGRERIARKNKSIHLAGVSISVDMFL